MYLVFTGDWLHALTLGHACASAIVVGSLLWEGVFKCTPVILYDKAQP